MDKVSQDRGVTATLAMLYYRARYYDPADGRFLNEDPLRAISWWGLNLYSYVLNNPTNLIDVRGLSPDCACAVTSQFHLVPISDCSYRGYRRIVYTLQGPGANKWWVTEHQDPKGLAPATEGSPEGQSTGDQGMFDDTIFGWVRGNSKQSFTISPEDPRKNPHTPSCKVNVRLPSGQNGAPQDYGTLGMFHGGTNDFTYINGASTGWAPCKKEFDEPGRQ
jgi:RHS repeat-associated protein